MCCAGNPWRHSGRSNRSTADMPEGPTWRDCRHRSWQSWHSREVPMVEHEVIGDDMQAVILTLAAGDVVRAEAGAMMFMTETIDMDAKMEGGFLGGLKRKFLSGESFFITYFRC